MNTIYHDHHQHVSMQILAGARKTVRCSRVLLQFMCAGVLLAMMLMGSAVRLHGQCGETKNLCDDSCCHTDAILLNTGYDHVTRGLYLSGADDNYWHIVDGPVTEPVLPTTGHVPDVNAEWGEAFPNTKWIDADVPTMDPNASNVRYEKCFCVCGAQSTLTFTLQITAGGASTTVSLDGEVIPVGAAGITFTRTLEPGRHCLDIEVHNSPYEYAPLNVSGMIQGPGLLKPTCCSTPSIGLSGCQTDHLTINSNNIWTIESGPAAAAPFPRCASDVLSPPAPLPNWIAPNTSEGSVNAGGTDTYVYRRSFCADRAGTFIITITSSVDDAGDIFLNGVLLGTAGGRGTPKTETFIVALSEGCNCIEFHVYDMARCCTGMSATVDIQGGILLKPECCSCNDCGDDSDPHGRPGIDNDEGNDRLSGMRDNAISIDPSTRPLLVSIPNPVTGESAVHYVLDREADARVELYNSAGQRVMTLDEGTRKSGEHVVNMATKELPAGAYQLLLVYGDRRLSVPVTVR